MKKIEKDLNLEVDLEEMDLIRIEVNQIDLGLEERIRDLNQDQRVIW